MSETSFLVHSKDVPDQAAGELLSLSRQQAGWEWMSLFVRRLQPGDVFSRAHDSSSASKSSPFVLLSGGNCQVDQGRGAWRIGKRKNVFDGLPYALVFPPETRRFSPAESTCEIAAGRCALEACLQP